MIRITELNCEFCNHTSFYDAAEFEKMIGDHAAWEKDGCPRCGRNT